MLQVLSATSAPLRFATDRLNMRYFTDATQDAVEAAAPTAADLRAGSAPYATAAAGSRRLAAASDLSAEPEAEAPVEAVGEEAHSHPSLHFSADHHIQAGKRLPCQLMRRRPVDACS